MQKSIKVLVAGAVAAVLLAGCGAPTDEGDATADKTAGTEQAAPVEGDATTEDAAAEEKAAEDAAAEEAAAEEKAAEEKAAEEKAAEETVSQANARGSAQDYLDYAAFSKSGLVEQLEFEGYSTKDATYAVNNVDVDWTEQAAKSAAAYMDYSSFSRSGLIDQLVFEGFSTKQAEHGADSVGL